MKMHILKWLGTILVLAMVWSCGSSSAEDQSGTLQQEAPKAEGTKTAQADAQTTAASDIGIGPIKEEIQLSAIDNALAEKGAEIFKKKCTQCHKVEKRYIGPALKCVTERRSPAWIMNMILNPEEMVKKDPIAKKLIGEYSAPMANQNLTVEEARALLEFLRTKC